jgi:hypothetical protein
MERGCELGAGQHRLTSGTTKEWSRSSPSPNESEKQSHGQPEPDSRKAERVVRRTALRISKAIDKMILDLQPGTASELPVAFDWAVTKLAAELAHLQPKLMQLIMEDQCLRERYDAATAEIPATAAGDPLV